MTMVYSNTENSLNNLVIRMENTLAKKSTKFNAVQQKLFYVCLASLNKGVNNVNEIEIDKQELFEYLNITSDDRWTRTKKQFKSLMKSSLIEFENGDNWESGFLITKTRSTRKKIYVEFAKDYLPLLIELSRNYTKLLNDDVTSFNSKFSMMLYQNLMRLNCYSNRIEFTTKQLKDMFGLNDDDYVYNDKFNRALFEKKTINLAVKEINEKSKCIRNLKYFKAYKGRQVACYVFSFTYLDPEKEKNTIETNGEQTSIFDFDVDDVKNLKWW